MRAFSACENPQQGPVTVIILFRILFVRVPKRGEGRSPGARKTDASAAS